MNQVNLTILDNSIRIFPDSDKIASLITKFWKGDVHFTRHDVGKFTTNSNRLLLLYCFKNILHGNFRCGNFKLFAWNKKELENLDSWVYQAHKYLKLWITLANSKSKPVLKTVLTKTKRRNNNLLDLELMQEIKLTWPDNCSIECAFQSPCALNCFFINCKCKIHLKNCPP